MPDWPAAVRARLAQLNLTGARESEIVEELSAHLDQRFTEMLAGQSTAEAERLALEELDAQDLMAGQLRKTRRAGRQQLARDGAVIGTAKGNFMSSFWHDLKVAARMLLSKPSFAAMVAGMLALGIAGNVAIFSVFDALILRPLPFADPQRLIDLDETAPKWNLHYVGGSPIDFYNWQEHNSTFDSMAAYGNDGANLSDSAGFRQRIKIANVTYNLLDVLGLKPALGRNFLPEEDRPKGVKVILLGHELWQSLFRGDRGIVGHVVKLDNQAYTVIGVLPREAVLPSEAQAWTTLDTEHDQYGSYFLEGVGRLKRGVTVDQARADLLRVHHSLANAGANSVQSSQKLNEITSPILTSLRERALGDLTTVTRVLLGAVAMVLLIACVNVAGLMLVRAEGRSREIAVRTAVGASRGRIVRQLFTESLLLAAAGGIGGVLLGQVFLKGLVSFIPGDVPRWVRFDLDWRFAIFAVAVTGAAAVVFGLAPAFQAASLDAARCLHEMGRSTLSRRKRRALGMLAAIEVTLAVMLLSSSGLLLEAFRKVLHTDPGFRTENVIAWDLRLPETVYSKPEQQYTFYKTLLDRLGALPGVRSASAASLPPLSGHSGYFFVSENGRQFGVKDDTPVTLLVRSMHGYFQGMGIRLVAGRFFDERDESRMEPRVAIVNETFARFYWPGQSAVGKRIAMAGNGNPWIEVVGVTRDTKHYGLDQEMKPCVFRPFGQFPSSSMAIVLFTAGDPETVVAPARQILAQLDPDLPMFGVRTMAAQLKHSLWERRAYSWLFAAFAAVAILLAAAGIYGVISFGVSRRTREIGIHMALGARPAQVMRTVLASGMTVVGIGAIAGLIASQFTARLLQSLLFGVSAHDVAAYAAVVAGVAAIGFLANYIPARRASRVDPTNALRFE
jgi:putative ABC transport system permease protein